MMLGKRTKQYDLEAILLTSDGLAQELNIEQGLTILDLRIYIK
jgi:hypothetical protein